MKKKLFIIGLLLIGQFVHHDASATVWEIVGFFECPDPVEGTIKKATIHKLAQDRAMAGTLQFNSALDMLLYCIDAGISQVAKTLDADECDNERELVWHNCQDLLADLLIRESQLNNPGRTHRDEND